MSLEKEILDSLQDLEYPDFGTVSDNVSLLTDLATFSSIISWISGQLQKIEGLESTVNAIKDPSEMVSFKIELNSLLRELESHLIDSDLSESKTKLYLLNSLCGQLMASIMTYTNRKSGCKKSMTIVMNESQTAKDLKYILITLGEKRKPPNDVTPQVLFNTIKDLLRKRLSQNGDIEDSLLLPDGLTLSPDQWKCLESINEELKKDYSIRRQMLLKRCDCTINSFTWGTDTDSEDMKKKINASIKDKRNQMTDSPKITIADALAARQSDCDSLINGVVSKNPTNCVIQVPDMKGMANKGLQQQIQAEELHKYRIGPVPDRGGRPNEQPKPPRESFTQQQFQRDNPQRGRGRGGGRGGGGGGGRGGVPNVPQDSNRIQGRGWVQNTGDRYSGDNQRRGYHQSNNNYKESHEQHYRQQRDYQYEEKDGYQEQYHNQQQHHYQQQQPQRQYYQNRNQNQSHGQQYDRQSYDNYSDQSYDDRQQYHQNKPYRGRGGFGGGSGGGRRY